MSWNKSGTFLQSSFLSLHLLLSSAPFSHRKNIAHHSPEHSASIHFDRKVCIEKLHFFLFFFFCYTNLASDNIADRNSIQKKLFANFVKWQYGTLYLLVPNLIYRLFIIVVPFHFAMPFPIRIWCANILVFCSHFFSLLFAK